LGRPLTGADDTVLEAVLQRDRQAVVAALIAVIAMAWVWILFGAGTGMSAIDMLVRPGAGSMAGMMAPAAWTLGYAGIMFAMWWVMMAAMMLPSAAPILLLFARINRQQKAAGRPFYPDRNFRGGLPRRRWAFSSRVGGPAAAARSAWDWNTEVFASAAAGS
jgi:predicted metal-binding membrane protein